MTGAGSAGHRPAAGVSVDGAQPAGATGPAAARPASAQVVDSGAAGAVPLPDGFVQRISPAGSGQETRWVLLMAVLVILFCAGVVGWQYQRQASGGLQSHQLDLAADLSASEQGVYTDLQVVHEEWVASGQPLPPPQPAQWASDGWPPFAGDLSERQRGARVWHLLALGGHHAYLGIPSPDRGSTSQAVPSGGARLILWRLPEKAQPNAGVSAADTAQQPAFDVWLREGEDAGPGEVPLSERLDDADLMAHGWRQVVVRRKQEGGP